jgi:hypothetical protein
MKATLLAFCLLALFAVPATAQLTVHPVQQDNADRLQKLQADLLAKWDKGTIVRLDSKELPKTISSIADKGTFPPPKNGTKVDLDTLTEEIRTDLDNAITGLIRAYCSELQTTAVISYMKERNESLDVKYLGDIRTDLKQTLKMSDDDLRAMPNDDLLRLFRGDDVLSHWSGVQPEDSFKHVWKSSEVLSSQVMADFATNYAYPFSRGLNYQHNFRPSTSLQDEIKHKGSVLFADVKLLIRFDDKLYNEPLPYFIRFWFCTVDKKWHPLQLSRSQIGNNSAANKILF